MSARIRKREYLRFKWSHRSAAHRLLVRLYNRAVAPIPFSLKYGIGVRLRRRNPPYALLRGDSIVVQVGAPADTLRAGRSRAMSFALLTRSGGKVLVVEPDDESAALLRAQADARALSHVEVCPVAAWSGPDTLRLRVDASHPATNFTEGCADYEPDEVSRFAVREVPADSVDNLVETRGLDNVDLVSLTTNGAENEILLGMQRLMDRGLPYISLAQTGAAYKELMETYGYEFFSHDDRGFTFRRRVADRPGRVD